MYRGQMFAKSRYRERVMYCDSYIYLSLCVCDTLQQDGWKDCGCCKCKCRPKLKKDVPPSWAAALRCKATLSTPSSGIKVSAKELSLSTWHESLMY